MVVVVVVAVIVVVGVVVVVVVVVVVTSSRMIEPSNRSTIEQSSENGAPFAQAYTTLSRPGE